MLFSVVGESRETSQLSYVETVSQVPLENSIIISAISLGVERQEAFCQFQT